MAAVRGHMLPTDRANGLDLTDFQAERDRISADMDTHRERDLVGYFVAVGYAGDRLAYHCDYHPTEAEGRPLGRYSGIVPTPPRTAVGAARGAPPGDNLGRRLPDRTALKGAVPC